MELRLLRSRPLFTSNTGQILSVTLRQVLWATQLSEKKMHDIEWLCESLNWVQLLIKINLVKLFSPGYVLKNFLTGFSKPNPVNLPNVAAATFLELLFLTLKSCCQHFLWFWGRQFSRGSSCYTTNCNLVSSICEALVCWGEFIDSNTGWTNTHDVVDDDDHGVDDDDDDDDDYDEEVHAPTS